MKVSQGVVCLLALIVNLHSITASRALDSVLCPQYTGPRHSQSDLQIEIGYLKPKPSTEQQTGYENLLEYPMGTLFGSASVYFSAPQANSTTADYFNLDTVPGKIIGMRMSPDKCIVTLDFIITLGCTNGCTPRGICLETNSTKTAEAGSELPYRKGCKRLSFFDRPICLSAEVFGLGMGRQDDGRAYTNVQQAKLMMIFEGPQISMINFKPEDFNASGPAGTKVVSVNAATSRTNNVAYYVEVDHGVENGIEKEVEICFQGSNEIRNAGIPFKLTKIVCAKYLRTLEAPSVVNSAVKLAEPAPRNGFCP